MRTVVPVQGFGEPLARTDPLGLAGRNPATEVREDPATLHIDPEEQAQSKREDQGPKTQCGRGKRQQSHEQSPEGTDPPKKVQRRRVCGGQA